MSCSFLFLVCRHMLLRYGTLNPENKKAVKQLLDPKARIEQLKMMYRNATSKESEGLYHQFNYYGSAVLQATEAGPGMCMYRKVHGYYNGRGRLWCSSTVWHGLNALRSFPSAFDVVHTLISARHWELHCS